MFMKMKVCVTFDFLLLGPFFEKFKDFMWETETLALRKIVFPKTGTKRKVLRPFCDEVTFQSFQTS